MRRVCFVLFCVFFLGGFGIVVFFCEVYLQTYIFIYI